MAKSKLARLLIDKSFTIAILASSALAISLSSHVVLSLVVNGLPALLEAGPSFLVSALPPATAERVSGGIGPALAGSLMTTFYASLIALPVSFLTGVFMAEFPRSALSKLARTLLHLLMEFPTVMIGMLSFALVVIPLGSYSMLAAAAALAIIMMPYVALGVEEALRMVPATYKEAGYSLGLSRARVVFRVAAKIAASGIVTAALVGVARGVGETAALLFTAGRALYDFPSPLPSEHLTQPVGAIPLLVYYFAASPYGIYRRIAWGASLVLFLVSVALLAVARKLVKEVRL